MGVGAEISIRALIDGVRIVETEIFLIFLLMIVLLHGRVRVGAAVAFRAFLFLFDVLAKLGVVDPVPPSIFGRVVVDAVFVVVIFGDVAG